MRLGTLAAICLFFATGAAFAEVSSPKPSERSHYIMDDLTVFIHAGSSREYRIIGTIVAGNAIEVLERNTETEFTKVKTTEGKTGWIENQYISADVSQKEQFELLKASVGSLESSLLSKQNELNETLLTNQNQADQLNKMTAQIDELNESLALKKSTMDSIEEEKLADQAQVQMEWLIKGGALALISLIVGYILAFIPSAKKRKNEWA